MAKKVTAVVKVQITGGKASPAPPVGAVLSQTGINIMGFCKEFNERTQKQAGLTIPCVLTVYQDRSYTFVTKSPTAAVLIKRAISLEKGSGVPNRDKVGKITRDQLKEIAEAKMTDLNAADMDAAIRMIAGTCRSMGVTVAD